MALNAADRLAALLAAVWAQSVQPAEVVVVDRGSSDGTVTVLSTWLPPPAMVFAVIEAVGTSISEARNVGIEAATFGRVIVTDATAIPDPEWVAGMWNALQAGAQVVGGRVCAVGVTAMERAVALARTAVRKGVPDGTFVPAGVNIAFDVAAWDAVGGFPEWVTAGEDAIFAAALRENGTEIGYAADAVTSWSPNLELAGLLAEAFRSSRARAHAGLRHHRRRRRVRGATGGVPPERRSSRIALRSAASTVRTLGALTSAAGYLVGAGTARFTRDPVHVRMTGSSSVEHCIRRVRWYPFDEEVYSAPAGPRVTSVGG